MGQTELKGNISVEVDDSGLEARLFYQPDDNGDTWTKGKISKLLSEHGITEGFSSEKIEETMKILDKEDTNTSVVAKGDSPELPLPEKVEWKDMPIPQSIEKIAEQALENASAPEITQTRIEKVQVEKTVQKKPALPFLPTKEEKKTVTEKRKVEEPVVVDPTVLDTGYAQKDDVIAKIIPGRPGKPGRSIYGKSVPPISLSEPAVYEGKGVSKRRSELVAEYSGFIRRGKNWVEIIPYKNHTWQLSLSKDKNTLYIDFQPGEKNGVLPEYGEIVNKADELGYPKEKVLSEEEVRNLLQNAVDQGTPLEKEPLCETMNGKYEIRISKDKIKAELYLRKAQGSGRPLKLKDVGAAISKSGLKGLNLEKIKKDIVEFYKGDEQVLENYILVQGEAPQRGKDREVKWELPFLNAEELARIKGLLKDREKAGSELTSLNEFPPDSISSMALVQENQKVGVITSPETGKEGVDVYGNKLPGLPGNDPYLVLHENIHLDKSVLTSDITGILDLGIETGKQQARVRKHKDAEVFVQISEGSMRAYLNISPHEGTGEVLTEEAVNQAIGDSEVKKGIKQEVIQDSLEIASQGNRVRDMLFAEGKNPVGGGAGVLNYHVQFSPVKGKDGEVSYESVSVKEGQIIGDYAAPSKKTEPGYDVLGNTIEPKSVEEDDRTQVGENVIQQQKADGGVVLKAGKSGELVQKDNTLKIIDKREISGNVDMKTGNIKFSGSVIIDGSVEPGFYVLSGGDIHVRDYVQAGLLSADGNIRIDHGVKGGGKAVLRAKKSILASFIEQAVLLSVGDIKIKNACMRSQVKCNGKLLFGSEKGNLIGGKTRSKKGIVAMDIGNEKGIRTEISFGQDYLIMDQIELEEKEIKKLRDNTSKLDTQMQKYEKAGNKKALIKLRQDKLKLLKIMEKRSMRLFNLRERFEEHFPSEIHVKGTVYPGVVIESHGREYEVPSKKSRVTISFNLENGRIEEKPLSL
ncbi:MAG: FapA family protein [Spirochaetia bacterium]